MEMSQLIWLSNHQTRTLYRYSDTGEAACESTDWEDGSLLKGDKLGESLMTRGTRVVGRVELVIEFSPLKSVWGIGHLH
jgi:hypothetical protein